MTPIENITLFLRIVSSIKEELNNENIERALAKLEILEGEINILRQALIQIATGQQSLENEIIAEDIPVEDTKDEDQID